MTELVGVTTVELTALLVVLATLMTAGLAGVHIRRTVAIERQARAAEITCRRIHELERATGMGFSPCMAREHCTADHRIQEALPR